MVINTNTQALATANNLNASNTQLAKALARLSSGAKIIVPSDDAAGLAVSSRLEAQVKRLDATVSNVINAISFTQTQDGFLKTVDKAFRRMGELAMLALDTTKSSEDLGLYNQEFIQLKDYVSASVGQTYNSIPLFSTTPIPVTIDSEGVTFAMSAINLDAPAYKTAINSGTDAWKLTADAWQASKDGYKTAATSYKTSVDLWRNNGGTWATTDNGGVKFDVGSVVSENVTSVDAKAKTLAAGSFASKGVTLPGFTTDYLTNKLTKVGHGLVTGDKIKLPSGAPNGTDSATEYYVNVSGDDLTLHTTKADATTNTSAVNLKAATALNTTLTGASVVASSDAFTKTTHGFENGDKVRFTGTAPAGADASTIYFVKKLTADTFEIYTDSALTAGNKVNVSTDTSDLSIESNKLTGVGAATDDVFTKTSHGLSTGDIVQATALDSAVGVTANTSYYVKNLTANTFEIYSDSALTSKVNVTAATAGSALRLSVEGNTAHVANLASEIKKGQFVAINPITTSEDIYAQKITSGSIVAVNESEQDISAFATELGADYDNVNLTSVAAAQIAIDLVKKATIQIATDRAKLGAMQSRLNFTHERLTVTKENLSVAISRIADVDVAEETTQYARYQILVQSGTSMLREANAMPQAALKLLQ